MPTRLNHMELTVPIGTLEEPNRSEIKRFYGEVFGWTAIDVKLINPNDLLFGTDEEVSQFILLVESENPLQSPSFDHLGLLQDTREEVDELLERCRKWQERDERVQIKEYEDLVYGDTTVRAFYVRHLLPLWFDVQTIVYADGAAPERSWRYA